MVSPILFAGGEDIDFQASSGIVVSSANSGQVTIDSTAGRFRAGFARYAIGLPWAGQNAGTFFSMLGGLFTAIAFWLSFRLYASVLWTGYGVNHAIITFYDTGGLPRLRIKTDGGSAVRLFSVNAAGTETQLGGIFSVSGPSAGLTKVDISVNYATAGWFIVYFNGVQVFSYAGDITTNGVTALGSRIDFGQWNEAQNQTGVMAYSEVIVATRDTRDLSLITQTPLAAGNTANFSSSVNVDTVTTSTPTTNSTSNQPSNEITYQKIIPPVSGRLTNAWMSLQSGISATAQMALYSDNAGNPGALLTTTGTVTNPGSGLTVYAFGTPPLLISGQPYWIAFRATSSYTMQHYAGATTTPWATEGGSGSFPANSAVAANNAVVMLIQYTINGPAVSQPQYIDANADNSGTAGQIQEYQVSPATPAGNYGVVSLVQKARVTVGVGGPTKLDFMVRTHGTDYAGADISVGAAWQTVSNNWDLNPNTGAAWQTSEITNASTTYNMGIKSVT